MKNCLTRIIGVLLCAIAIQACSGLEREITPNRRVLLLYAAGYSNLSSSISKNIDEICSSDLPYVGNEDVFLVYSHFPSKYSDYSTPTEPVLFRAYMGPEGTLRKDTLVRYPATDISGSPDVLRKVLSDVRERFPASSYGMVFSSHGKGWVPIGYKENSYSLFSAGAERWADYPLTKELGIENVDGSGIDIRDLPGAIPMHLDFIIMDACLMGCVEVAYELKDQCTYLVVSPTEILSAGMDYVSMSKRLLNIGTPDLKGVCEDFFDLYRNQTGLYQSATITLVDCPRTAELADAFRDIVSSNREGLDHADRSKVQPYFYNDFHWFFDLRDLLVESGATSAELARLDAALDKCVLYKAATEKFFDLKLESVCGLSVYFPIPGKTELNNYYKTLSWNKATGLIQ